MRTIHQLSPHLIAKIAAGEVIERPSYAVKELIENAIDANADYITIQIEDAGLKKIIITDNGIGMSREDLEECFKPHTTSKISQEENLVGIKTFGFRGEAVASIAAISNLTIKSRIEDTPGGTMIELQNGNIKKISPVGSPVGTSIIIDNLFHNVPARKKFLKSRGTEFRHIIETVTQYAIGFPHIRFFLSHNKNIMLDLPKNQNVIERIKMLLGKDIFDNLVTIETQDSYIKIKGFLSKPQITTTGSNKQFIFINGRKISDKLITLAVKEAYGNLLEATAYPIFILFLTMPYEAVDVNVHPRKEQVSFINNTMIFEMVNKSVSQTLIEKNLTFHAIRWKHDPLYDETKQTLFSPKKGNTNSYAGRLLKDAVLPNNIINQKIPQTSPIEQLHNLYLLAQTNNGIVFIDQHAAHERILFEQFAKEFKNKKSTQQYMLEKQETFEVSLSDAEILEEHKKIFEKIGFSIEHFQGNTFRITAVPFLLKDRRAKEIIVEMLDDIAQEKTIKEIDKQSYKMLTYLACRSAIKAGDVLTKQQMKEIVNKLETTPNNATCPHGRPTKVAVQLHEINKMFKRK